MLKRLGLLCLWLGATLAAVSVSWAGVRVVDAELVSPPPATSVPAAAALPIVVEPAVAVSEGEADGADPVQTTTQDPASAVDGPGDDAVDGSEPTQPAADDAGEVSSSTATTTPPAGTGASVTTTTTVPTSTGGPSTTVPTTTVPTTTVPTTTIPPSTSSPTTTTVPPSTSTSTTTTTIAPPQIQTFNLVGGSAGVSFSQAEVIVQWATPNPGFSVEIEPESPGWKVEFRSDDHRSRVDVWWASGPQSEVREEAD